MASCGSSADEEPQPGGGGTSTAMEAPMTFRASGTEALSRSTYAQTVFDKFAVVAWKTNAQGTKEYVMSKNANGNSPYIVEYEETSGWHYADLPNLADQYLKYWDFSAKDYTFYAIANYADLQNVSYDKGFTITGNSDAANDVLECHYKRVLSPVLADYDLLKNASEVVNTPISNGQIPAMADVVPLVFHHLMAQVQFLIYDSQNEVIPVKHLTITIPEEETYGLITEAEYKYGAIVLANSTSEKNLCDKDLTDISTGTKANPTLLHCAYELPQSLTQTVELMIETDRGVFFGNIPLGNQANNFIWQKDMLYKYVLIVQSGGEIILVNLQIEDWELEDEIIEKEQTNW